VLLRKQAHASHLHRSYGTYGNAIIPTGDLFQHWSWVRALHNSAVAAYRPADVRAARSVSMSTTANLIDSSILIAASNVIMGIVSG
jgi:hypothetical protein